jgi:hypothetical protein
VVLQPDALLFATRTWPPPASLGLFPPSPLPATQSTHEMVLEHAPLAPSVHKLVVVHVLG